MEQLINTPNALVSTIDEQALKKIRINKIKKIIISILLFLLSVFFAFICLVPIYLLAVNATRTKVEIASSISFLPSNQLFVNIKRCIEIMQTRGDSFTRGFWNSFIIALLTTIISIYFSAVTTYGFQIYNFKGKKFLYSIVLAILLIPSQLGMIGWVQLVVDLGLTDTYIPLILPSIAAAGTVFFLRQYMQATFSEEIVQAARIDGASEIHAFHRICLPLIMPALATMAIFTFIFTWNNYQGPLLILNTNEKFTLPMIVARMSTSKDPDHAAMTAGTFLSLLPLLVMYLVFSKPIISGVAFGGVKE